MENKNKLINKKSFSRFFATQILFAYFSNRDGDSNMKDLSSFLEEYYIADEFNDNNAGDYQKSVNMAFLNELLSGTVEHLATIDAILEENLTGKYTFDAIDEIIKNILRLAVFEFQYTDTEKKIIINEYVDISAEYFNDKAVSFVNATLDKLSKVEK